MKLLIVDDAYSKVEEIAALLKSESIEVEVLDHETNARSARKRLADTRYDLAIIDVNLPDLAGAPATDEGGFRLIQMMMLDRASLLPSDFLFATALDGIADEARAKAESLGIPLCLFSTATTAWRNVVAGKAKLAARRAAATKRTNADIAIVTALATPELEAVLGLPLAWKVEQFSGDPTVYHLGTLKVGDREISLVAASALRKGMAASAALATKIALLFRPRLMAMLGICAGVEGKVQLGDVVVGDPTWDWGSGKNALDAEGNPVFKLSPIQRPLKSELVNLCHQISNSADFKSRTRAAWSGSTPQGQFSVHMGPMASGASVIADSNTAVAIAAQNRDLISMDMEAFAVMTACEYAASDGLAGIAIKSVCDFANAEKGDDWQKYASYTSAAFAAEFFMRFAQTHPEMGT